jgi:3-oxosteroid 1-dehydrogenase
LVEQKALHKGAVVIGSGAAGLTAALALRLGGPNVTLIEAEDVLGGTSAIGGGNLWIPHNGPMIRAGRPDDRSLAYKYLRRVSGTQPHADNANAFVEHGARMVEFLESSSTVRFSSIPRHDYHATWDGAGFGRSLEPEPFAAGELLAEKAAWFATNPTRAPLTYVEYREGAEPQVAERRRHDDVRTQGAALVAGLGHACLNAGVEVIRGAPVESLSRSSPSLYRLQLRDGRRITADAIILATGGYAGSDTLRRAMLPGVEFISLAAGRSAGDGLQFGLDCGAALFGLGDGWLGAGHRPDDGRPPFLVVRELALPGSMLINGDGRRFVNEALGYNDVGRGMLQFDPGRGSYFCASAWLIFDSDFRERRPVLGVAPDAPVPDNWRCTDTMEGLANMLSVPADELVRSVTIMNDAARSGYDREFGRGGDAHQIFNGEAGYGSNPCLGIIAKAPFFAVPISPALCGTKGGLEVDAHARVIGRDHKAIDGLYACGDVASSIMGFGYAGAGASIGPAMTFAFLAAEDILRTRGEATEV